MDFWELTLNKINNLIGKKFGLLTVISFSGNRTPNGNYIWVCVCECGKKKNVAGGNFSENRIMSCGCYKYNRIDKNRKNKVCSKCLIEKPITNFNKNKSRNDGYSQFCKECVSVLDRLYRPKQRESRNLYQKNRRKTDINFKIADNLRRRLNQAIKSNTKAKNTISIIGCEISFLRNYLESRFRGNMSWSNYGDIWEIDHVRPCASFDLSIPGEQERCFNYKNLQPLFNYENRSKGSLYDGKRYAYK